MISSIHFPALLSLFCECSSFSIDNYIFKFSIIRFKTIQLILKALYWTLIIFLCSLFYLNPKIWFLMCYCIVTVLFWLFFQFKNSFVFIMNSVFLFPFLILNLSLCLHCTDILSWFWSTVWLNLYWQLKISLLIGCLSNLRNNFRAVSFSSEMFSIKS